MVNTVNKMKYFVLILSIFISAKIINCMEDGGDPSRRGNTHIIHKLGVKFFYYDLFNKIKDYNKKKNEHLI